MLDQPIDPHVAYSDRTRLESMQSIINIGDREWSLVNEVRYWGAPGGIYTNERIEFTLE